MISLLPFEIPAPVFIPSLRTPFMVFTRHKTLAIVLLIFLVIGAMTCFHLLKRVIELNPIFYGPEFRSMKALALYEFGAYGKAAAQYRLDYAEYLNIQGLPPPLVLLLRKDSEAAVQWAAQQLEHNPDDIEALLTSGVAAYDAGAFPKAWQYGQHVLRLYWDNTDALLLAALVATRDPSLGDPFLYLNRALRTGTAARNLLSFVSVLEITGILQRQKASERQHALLLQYLRLLKIHDAVLTTLVMRTAQ